jgi:hypothetical protein
MEQHQHQDLLTVSLLIQQLFLRISPWPKEQKHLRHLRQKQQKQKQHEKN